MIVFMKEIEKFLKGYIDIIILPTFKKFEHGVSNRVYKQMHMLVRRRDAFSVFEAGEIIPLMTT